MVKKRICILASYAPSILNFRKELVLELLKTCDVYVCAPQIASHIEKEIMALGVSACKDISFDIKSTGLLSNVRYLYLLFLYFKKIKPDILLSYTIKPVIWGSFAAKLAGVKKCTSMITGLGYAFIGLETLKKKIINQFACFLYKNALRYNDVVFFQNKDDQALFTQKKLIKPASSVLLNGSGVNLSHYAYTSSFPDGMTFLMVCRLLKDKGVYEYAEAAKQILKTHPEVRFHLVGEIDHNPSAICKKDLERWHEAKVLHYLGPKRDVRESLEMASVFVLPSYREGTPRSVLEAMSMGRPIITTDAPGCRETVVQGKNGFLVPVQSVEHLVWGMRQFLENPSCLYQFGKASREIVVEKYNVDAVNQVIIRALL